MSAGQLGYLSGAFGIALVCAILTKWVAQLLRARITIRYTVAGVAAFVPSLIPLLGFHSFDPADALSVLGSLLAAGVMFWWFIRDQAAEAKRTQSTTEK